MAAVSRVAVGLLVLLAAAVAQAATYPGWPIAPETGAFFGVSVDVDHTPVLSAYSQVLGVKPVSYVVYTDIPMNETGKADTTRLHHTLEQVAAMNGVGVVVALPKNGLDAVTDKAVQDIADIMVYYESKGANIMFQFAHEMNGCWYVWGQSPTKFIPTYQKVARIIRNTTCRAAMVWTPNDGGGYPYSGVYQAVKGTQDFNTLDTNKDGVLDQSDDMYTPFYPGDDYVDWVGMSLYHFGVTYPFGANVVPEDRKFSDKLEGTYNGPGGDQSAIPNFYKNFCEDGTHNKPLMITETGAAYYPRNGAGATELAIKQKWWQQVFNQNGDTPNAKDVTKAFPMLKMINWFDISKIEDSATDGLIVDWKISGASAIRDPFVAYITAGSAASGNITTQAANHWKFLDSFTAMQKTLSVPTCGKQPTTDVAPAPTSGYTPGQNGYSGGDPFYAYIPAGTTVVTSDASWARPVYTYVPVACAALVLLCLQLLL